MANVREIKQIPIDLYKAELERILTTPAARKATIKPPRVGAAWPSHGGIYAGIVRHPTTNRQWHLILAVPQNKLAWGEYGMEIEGADDYWDGAANTKAMLITNKCPAATWAASLCVDGRQDFYIPAQRELNILCANVPDHFENIRHWSSTQCSADSAWDQNFENGGQRTNGKGNEFAVRAVRRLPI